MNEHGQGMIPAGKYIHKSTGKVIHVRDSFQDGDNLVIMSDQGQLSMKEFGEYFQVEEGEDMYIPNIQDLYGGGPKNKNQLLAQINQGLDPEDRIKLDTDKKITTTITNQPEEKKSSVSSNKNYDLIKKVFDKYPIERSINFEIVEEEWPFKEFSMLVNILDVPVKDICNYVIDNFFDKEHLAESLSEYFEEHIGEC
jgi:hypothetical protein